MWSSPYVGRVGANVGKFYKEDKEVQCPFYIGDKELQLKCESIIGRTAVNYFETRAELVDYKDDFCRSLYKSCPYYQLLMEKYEDG